MSTKQATIENVDAYPTRRWRNRRIALGGAGVVVAATVLAMSIAVVSSDDQADPAVGPSEPAVVGTSRAADAVSSSEVLRMLIDRGLVPAKALEPAPRTADAIMQDLVDLGLVPAEAIQPGPKTGDDLLRDLVYQGLIPREVLGD